MFTLAHLSDLHATPVRIRRIRSFLNKRALGWLSWWLRRRKEYRPEVLQALVANLQVEPPDHVVVTGDLTNISLEEEFPAAVTWLQQFGGPRHVSIVPGNHDVYVPMSQSSSWRHWAQYLESDVPEYANPKPSQELLNRWEVDFPTVRVRGPVALIGVCSARPTAPFYATGMVGTQQLEKFERILQELATSALCRVVLIHHPPTEEGLAPRRHLTDAASLREILLKAGADLVLHGHMHKTAVTSLPGPAGPIPVVGVRSSSAIGHRPGRRAQYHRYRIERQDDKRTSSRFRIRMIIRSYHVEHGLFLPDEERVLSP